MSGFRRCRYPHSASLARAFPLWALTILHSSLQFAHTPPKDLTLPLTVRTFCRMRPSLSAAVFSMIVVLASCETVPNTKFGEPNMGGPTRDERRADIAGEQTGDFYIGRRYHVNRTWWWGYLRRPREPWSKGRLVVFNQNIKRSPDNLPQNGPSGERHAYDQNYEYRIWGEFTGEDVYEPNSNQFLPEFRLTDYEVLNRNPGWLFYPSDHYDPYRLTLKP